MRFKDFIQEKAMNMKTYSDTAARLKDTVKVGFEFEMIIPETSALFAKTGTTVKDRNSVTINSFDSFDGFDEMFFISRSEKSSIFGDFSDWADEQAKENDTRPDDYSFEDWLDAEFTSRYRFATDYSLEPKFGWANESPRYARVYTEPVEDVDDATMIFMAVAENVAHSLSKIVNQTPIIYNAYHASTKLLDKWYIEPDSSVGTGENGLELVSPPMALDASLDAMKKVFEWMDKNSVITDRTTGFHINVSLPGIATIDPLKLILFMGEAYVSDTYNRLGNIYAKSQISKVLSNIKDSGTLPDIDSIAGKVWSLIGADKHYTVNFKTLSKGYLEFRIVGNKHYEMDVEKVEKTVLRFVTATSIANDPKAERNEYVKKLSKLLNRVGTEIQQNKSAGINVPKELKRLANYNSSVERAYTHFDDHRKKFELLELLTYVVQTVGDFKTMLTLEERVFFKRLIKEVELTGPEVDEHYGSDTINRLRFKKELGI